MEEQWRDIAGYKGLYQVSNKGRVKRCANNKQCKEKILKQHLSRSRNGYLFVRLSKNDLVKNSLVHRLVAIAFLDNPQNLAEVHHLDHYKLNNNVSNLEWTSRSQNMAKSKGRYNKVRAFMNNLFMKEYSIV